MVATLARSIEDRYGIVSGYLRIYTIYNIYISTLQVPPGPRGVRAGG